MGEEGSQQKQKVSESGDTKRSESEDQIKRKKNFNRRLDNKAVVWMKGECLAATNQHFMPSCPSLTETEACPSPNLSCTTNLGRHLAQLTSSSCDAEQDRLACEYMSVLEEYQSFFQQQFSFVKALEFAKTRNEWDTCATMEIRSMENVETYMHKLSFTDNVLHSRVMHLFYRLYKRCMAHFNNLVKFFQVFVAPYTPYDSTRTHALRNLNKLTEMLHRRYQFYDLRVDNPHQQVMRLSVYESRCHYGGAVSFLPVVLDLLDDTRTIMFHLIGNAVQKMDPTFEKRCTA